jgi:ribosomal protein L11 methyltransferase
MNAPSAVLDSELPLALSDAAAALLHWSGALGVELDDGDEMSPPGSTPLPDGRARLRGHFTGLAQAREALALLRDRLGVDGILSELPEADWVEAFKTHFTPRRVGGIFLTAPWHQMDTPSGLTGLVIEPGLAFGTGHHPTTELCLRAVESFLAARPGSSVLDVGTGSGILAIAAAKLGAGRVVGSDNDPRALQEARANAARNGLDLPFSSLPPAESFDLVLANILANTLVDLAPALTSLVRPGGELCLSGILASQADQVAGAYAPGFSRCERLAQEGWVLLRLSKEVDHEQG